MRPVLGLFIMVDSECRIDTLLKYYVLFIDLAAFNYLMSACVIVCGCAMPGLGLCLMGDSMFVAACRRSLEFSLLLCRID